MDAYSLFGLKRRSFLFVIDSKAHAKGAYKTPPRVFFSMQNRGKLPFLNCRFRSSLSSRMSDTPDKNKTNRGLAARFFECLSFFTIIIRPGSPPLCLTSGARFKRKSFRFLRVMNFVFYRHKLPYKSINARFYNKSNNEKTGLRRLFG